MVLIRTSFVERDVRLLLLIAYHTPTATIALQGMQLSVHVVVSVLLLVGPSRSQAPGDADTVCTVLFAEQHPVYPNNIKVLMDSADYQNLITTGTTPGPVWQTVDVDNIDTMAVRVSVSRTVCMKWRWW